MELTRKIVLGIGSNLGHRVRNIEACLALVEDIVGCVKATSGLYETSPVGVGVEHPPYLNAVAEVESSINCPVTLLNKLKEIERALGRKFDSFEMGVCEPRVADLDILYFDDEKVDICEPRLTIPHPRIRERLFVLQPLADLDPCIKLKGTTVQELIDEQLKRENKCDPVFPVGKELWSLREGPRLMGILNVTPDSFSDGAQEKFMNSELFIERGLQMFADGAAIVDIGGESTRPGASNCDPEEQLRRVIPVIEGIRKHSDAPISIDTRNPRVAEEAIRAGADLINDVSSEPQEEMFDLSARERITYSIMHARGDSQTMSSLTDYENLVNDVGLHLRNRLSQCECRGIRRWRLMADVGIGFAKTREQNFSLIRHLPTLKSIIPRNVPLLIGYSRKRFLSAGGEEAAPFLSRAWAGAACGIWGALHGADVLRVHDVKETGWVMRCLNDIRGATNP